MCFYQMASPMVFHGPDNVRALQAVRVKYQAGDGSEKSRVYTFCLEKVRPHIFFEVGTLADELVVYLPQLCDEGRCSRGVTKTAGWLSEPDLATTLMSKHGYTGLMNVLFRFVVPAMSWPCSFHTEKLSLWEDLSRLQPGHFWGFLSRGAKLVITAVIS